MTYYPGLKTTSLDRSQGTLSSPSSISANQRIPCSSITHNNLTINSDGQLVLNSGHTFVLSASPYQEQSGTSASIVTYSWYDVTNSTEIGRDLQLVTKSGTITSGLRGCLARCVIETTTQTTVEFRITAVNGTPDRINSIVLYDYLGSPWYSVLSF